MRRCIFFLSVNPDITMRSAVLLEIMRRKKCFCLYIRWYAEFYRKHCYNLFIGFCVVSGHTTVFLVIQGYIIFIIYRFNFRIKSRKIRSVPFPSLSWYPTFVLRPSKPPVSHWVCHTRSLPPSKSFRIVRRKHRNCCSALYGSKVQCTNSE